MIIVMIFRDRLQYLLHICSMQRNRIPTVHSIVVLDCTVNIAYNVSVNRTDESFKPDI